MAKPVAVKIEFVDASGALINALRLMEGEQGTLYLKVSDDKGHTAKLDGKPGWVVVPNGVVVVLTIATNGLSGDISESHIGKCVIRASGDALVGSSVQMLTAVLPVEVMSSAPPVTPSGKGLRRRNVISVE